MRKLTLSLFVLALLGAGFWVAGAAVPGEHVVCATATVPPQTIAANSSPIATIPGAGDTQCVTATDQTVTVTTTVNGTTTTVPTTTTTPTTTTAPTTTTTPPPGPQTWLYPFRAGQSVYTTLIPASPAIDPASSSKIAYFLANDVRSPNMAISSWSVAVRETTNAAPLGNVVCTRFPCPYLIAQNPVPIPAGTKADPSTDGHLALWNSSNHEEYDFSRSACATNCWSTGSGDAFNTDGNGVGNPNPGGSSNAAGLSLLGTLIRPEELAAGKIDHAIGLAFPSPGTGFRCPASHTGGSNTNPSQINEGTLLQLDPSLNVAGLSIPAWQKTIAVAMQKYGAYIRDNGGTLSTYAENPVNRATNPYPALGFSGSSASFSSAFPWSSLRVLMPPAAYC